MSAVQRRLSRACFHVGRGSQLQSGGACGLFFIFLNQAANGVGRLGAAREPVLNAIELERAVVPLFFRVISADQLEKFSVAWTAFIGHDDLIIRAIESALPAESN
jgi:hypothetical protein